MLIELLLRFGPWGIVLLIIYLLFMHPEKLDIWVGKISAALSSFSIFFDKTAVEKDIKAKILSASKELNTENGAIVPYKLHIDWVDHSDASSFIKDGQIVVRMRYHEDQARNLVVAATHYIKKGVLPEVKSYVLTKEVVQATDLSLTRKILISQDQLALNYFDEEIILPLIEEDPELRELFNIIRVLDESGVLISIIFRELTSLKNKIFPSIADDKVKSEAKNLFYYMYKIVSAEKGYNPPLFFDGRYKKIAVVIVANPDTYLLHGLQPYKERIKKNLDSGVETIYVIGSSQYKDVARGIKIDTRIKSVKELPYYYLRGHRKTKSFCYALYT